ncbi:hypothetical protein PIB30_094825, partial [Stylosanthes scabra]|nr:hypothetical protein [Stylosanthes scabra]
LGLSGNNISGPLPSFDKSLKIVIDGSSLQAPSSSSSSSSSVNRPSPSSGRGELSSVDTPLAPSNSKRKSLVLVVAPIAGVAAAIFLLIPIYLYCFKGRNEEASKSSSSLVVHPRDPSDSDNVVKLVVASNGRSISTTVSGSGSRNLNTVLRDITKNFAPENELGRGGFGGVYKGELDDGTKVAVKRMEAGVISNKALDEFQSEIAVLSKVRHRNLVSLLGYSVEGTERLLVYEFLPQGALSKHLFHWKSLQLELLSWKRRLNIALDVARGMEYLHTLAHQSFIHRYLKSSNILLGCCLMKAVFLASPGYMGI